MKLQITPREKHIKRGYCCGNGCKLCPYEPRHEQGSTEIWECNPDGECWCKELPNVMEVKLGGECLSPSQLKRELNDKVTLLQRED